PTYESYVEQATAPDHPAATATPPRTSSPSTDSSTGPFGGACAYCYEKHRKCYWSISETRCDRCHWGNRICMPRETRATTGSPSSQAEEDAIRAELNEKDRQINAILEQYSPGSASRPHSNSRRTNGELQRLLERLERIPTNVATDATRAGFVHRSERSTPGNEYWQEGPSSNLLLRGLINERTRLPDILLGRFLGSHDANRLFNNFMRNWNHGLGLLDPYLHSPRTLLQRCPLLFTVVLAIASRDDRERPDLHERLMQQAKLSAAAALTDGWKSADTVQALLLMASYPPPVRRFTEDRTSLFIGMAIRMALDRKLYLASDVRPESDAERLELANHIRTWRACVLLDGSSAVKFGRSPSLREMGTVVQADDIRDAQTGFEIRIFVPVNHFLHLARSGNTAVDYSSLTRNFDSDINALYDEIGYAFQRSPDRHEESGVFRREILNLTMDYARMVVYSFAFTREIGSGNIGGGSYLPICFQIASASVRRVLERLAPLPQFKYSPDGWFEYAAFSAAFLIKVMRPQFSGVLDQAHRQRVAELVKGLVDMYRSPAVALLADNHLPRLLAQFLESAARNIPEYRQASSSRGLSRTSPTTPSPPLGPMSGFDIAPSEALMNALSSSVPEWWETLDHVLPGLTYP
ncbi:hypothetical protein FS749_006904, partial [Ceratobasidium sp. UAMH 11750]